MLPTILISILIFGFLIIIHEFGHFIAARISKVDVLEFAIGMGPVIYSRPGKRTKFSLRALPVGGFCRMKGEDENDYSEGSFNEKSKRTRIFILASGALMNIIGAVVLLSLVFFLIGYPVSTLGEVETEFPAYEAGIRAGDRVVSIDGTQVETGNDISLLILDDVESTYLIELERDGSLFTAEVTSRYDDMTERFRIGVVPDRKLGGIASIGQGIMQTILYGRMMVDVIGQLITGSASTGDLIGPIGVVSVVGETVQYGMIAMLHLAAIISLNLAIFNLLPIPALDGSRIIFILIEWIKGSPVDPEKEGMIHLIGFALLIILALIVAYNDILRFN